MFKKIVLGVIAVMIISSVVFAAPVMDLDKGQSIVGYSYNTFNSDTKSHNYFIQTAIQDKFIVGVEGERLSNPSWDSATLTDLYVQYKLDKNFRLVAGGRRYAEDGESDTVFLYGFAAKTEMSNKMSGYANLLFADSDMTEDSETAWNAGIIYEISKDAYFDINYKSHDWGNKWHGVGAGLTFKF